MKGSQHDGAYSTTAHSCGGPEVYVPRIVRDQHGRFDSLGGKRKPTLFAWVCRFIEPSCLCWLTGRDGHGSCIADALCGREAAVLQEQTTGATGDMREVLHDSFDAKQDSFPCQACMQKGSRSIDKLTTLVHAKRMILRATHACCTKTASCCCAVCCRGCEGCPVIR